MSQTHLAPNALAPAQERADRHLNQNDVARRWNISPRTLERWRCSKRGPAYLKIGGRVVYRLEDIFAFEAAQLRRIAGRSFPDRDNDDRAPRTEGCDD
jgi:hypothetical protein